MKSDPPPVFFRDLFAEADRPVPALTTQLKVRELDAEYRPWRKLRVMAREAGLDPVDAWCAAKLTRRMTWSDLELRQANGEPFGYCSGNHLLEPLHRIDRAVGGGGPASIQSDDGLLADEAHRTRLRVRTLMDEAAESSVIEGAATTRKEALELLRSGRDARTKGERMVINNYVAMQRIKGWLGRPLSVDMLLELRGILTDDTLENPDESRRFRRPDENVRVEHYLTRDIIFTPPPASGVKARIQALCDFANREHAKAAFIHPIVKAAILHFMIGYEHPFVDGNGRTARAVFYWFALRSGYTVFEYMPISERIRAGRSRYPQAFVDCEDDDGDLTYFILYHLDIVEQSLDLFSSRLHREEQKIKRSERLLRLSNDLNLRQRLLLEHALRHPRTTYTVKSHMNSNGITTNTARSDLDDLVRRRLMSTSKRGREVLYHASPTLVERLERKGL